MITLILHEQAVLILILSEQFFHEICQLGNLPQRFSGHSRLHTGVPMRLVQLEGELVEPCAVL